MKPLISYHGGKQRIASKIVAVLEKIPHTVYCEPFAGGLAVFYARSRPLPSNKGNYREVINDYSELLINLYRTAREHPNEFCRIIELTPYSRSEHQRAVEICKYPEQYNDLDRAWAYYININQSFSCTLNRGCGTSVCSGNDATTWSNRRKRMPESLERLQDVHIECDDALKVIARWDSPQTLFYLDPPYPNTSQGHYSGYSLSDWQALCDLLDSIQGSYVLSNYLQLTEPKSSQTKIEINTICSASGKGKVGKNRDKSKKASSEELGDRDRTEILWICDRSKNMRSELTYLAKIKQLSLF